MSESKLGGTTGMIELIEAKEVVTIKVIETVKGSPRVMEGARVTLGPVFDLDAGGKALKTGVSRADWETFYKKDFGEYDAFWKEFVVVLTAATRTFDLSDPYNRIVVAFMKAHPYVAENSNSITQTTKFVMYDEVEEAKKENKRFEFELRAYTAIQNMSQDEKAQFLKLFGFKNTESISPELILKRLKDKADKDPKVFIDMWEDKNREYKVLLSDLAEKHIIKRTGGAYYYGEVENGILIGTNEVLAIEFLKDPKHSDLYTQLKRLLKEAKKK